MYAARSTNCSTNIKKATKSSPVKHVNKEREETASTRPHLKSIEELSRETRFSKEEIKAFYRGFKQYCPNGYLTENALKKIYNLLFPFGDSHSFVGLVFHMLDRDGMGLVTFEQLFQCLAEITQGTEDEMLGRLFDMYDLDKNGFITLKHITYVVQCIYQLAGRHFQEEEISRHATVVFQRLGGNEKQDSLTLEDFIAACRQDGELLYSLTTLARSSF